MAGYSGYSMSNNAVQAYEEGLKPKAAMVKHYDNFTSKLFNELEEQELVWVEEWHHTSKKYNRTNFYKISLTGLFFLSTKKRPSKTATEELVALVNDFASLSDEEMDEIIEMPELDKQKLTDITGVNVVQEIKKIEVQEEQKYIDDILKEHEEVVL